MKRSIAAVGPALLLLNVAVAMRAQGAKPQERLRALNEPIALSDWKRAGGAALAEGGSPSVRFGASPGAVRARFKASGPHAIYVAATLAEGSAGVEVQLIVRCLDRGGKPVLTQVALNDPANRESMCGVYFKSHPNTRFLEVEIEKRGDAGEVSLTSVELRDDDLSRRQVRSRITERDYLRPFWNGASVVNETVLFEETADGSIVGKLVFRPTRIQSVRDYGLRTSYRAGFDYKVDGDVIRLAGTSKIPFLKRNEIKPNTLQWFEFLGKHVVVSYEHADRWTGPVPIRQGDLPNTLDKLRKRQPLTIVAYGDSITYGTGTSRASGIAPGMPTWADLVVAGLRGEYDYRGITLHNMALGGMTSDWGVDEADATVADLQPDLVLIAFGMNDFWWMPADHFKANVIAMMERVRRRSPRAEFILISPMRFDPAYTADPQYVDRLASYAPALASLQRVGVQLLDMTAITAALYARKSPHDFVSDPLHPNDYLARWYAQGVVEMLKCKE